MRPAQIFRSCKIGANSLYTFHSGVTVLSQQIRALNLAWAFIEGKIVDCVIPNRRTSKPKTVAIVGGGFAGLTSAAGLIAKRANVEITIFEERETLSCPFSTAATLVGFILKSIIGPVSEAK